MLASETTMHRIYVEFEGGYFVTSLDPEFNLHMQEMVADLGRPVKVEFRTTDEGWYEEEEIEDKNKDRLLRYIQAQCSEV